MTPLKSAHTDQLFVVSNPEKRSKRFYIGEKVSAHEPIFTPIFGLRQKIGPCALGIRRFPFQAIITESFKDKCHKNHHNNFIRLCDINQYPFSWLTKKSLTPRKMAVSTLWRYIKEHNTCNGILLSHCDSCFYIALLTCLTIIIIPLSQLLTMRFVM